MFYLPFPPSDNHIHIIRRCRGRIIRVVGKKGKEYFDKIVEKIQNIMENKNIVYNPEDELIIQFTYFLPDYRHIDIIQAGKKLINDAIQKVTGVNDSHYYNQDIPEKKVDKLNPGVLIKIFNIGKNLDKRLRK